VSDVARVSLEPKVTELSAVPPTDDKTPPALAEAYKELQQHLQPEGEKTAEAKAAETPAKKEEEAKETTPPPDQQAEDAAVEAGKAVVAKAGLNYDELAQSFEKDGKLDDKAYEALDKAGFPRPLVDAYLNGRIALAKSVEDATSAFVEEMYTIAGGKDDYSKMIEWAGQSLSKAEQEAFNDAVANSDRRIVKMAVQGLREKYTKGVGNDPDLVGGSRQGGAGGAQPFKSQAEIVSAMSDARYAKDEAYRAEVQSRLAVTDL
jgi:hypothetical protein